MRLIRTVLAATFGVLTFTGVHAQGGEQPIRIVMPYPAGGAGDTTARMLAGSMRTSLKRPVIVENKPGAAGRLGVQAVKESPADGTVLLFTPIAPMAVFPHTFEKLGYDPVADFTPISQVATFDRSWTWRMSLPAQATFWNRRAYAGAARSSAGASSTACLPMGMSTC